MRTILADLETPITAYWKLAADQPLSFLLESVTGGEQVGRFSLIGAGAFETMRLKGHSDPLGAIRERMGSFAAEAPEGLEHFIGGALGMLAYDLVRTIERLPGTPADDLDLPDVSLMMVDALVVFDHAKNAQRIVVLAEEGGEADAESRADAIAARLRAPLPPLPTGNFPADEPTSNMPRERFEAAVERMKEYIAAGDGVQMVPSQRFETPCGAHPLTVYRALRSLNPSPYMFLLRFGDFDLVGASPELLTSLHGGEARVRPIAGTRPRGRDAAEDARLAEELLADPKERAEHVMLVDLGRNDLGRVCATGTVTVNELMVIERYSHVMHIVSDVTGRLAADRDAYDLVRATFPAGTVSGAPKVRAMEIIDELEPTRRGSYAGAVGWFGVRGDLDLCITLRTILLKDGRAYVQAGGGVVADSTPTGEWEESRAKARAPLAAIRMACEGLGG